MYRTRILALLLGAAVPGTALAQGMETLPLTGKWVANYDPDGCHLLGQFGSGDAAVIARLTRYQPGDNFALSLFGKRFRSNDPTADATIDFGLGSTVRSTALLGKSGDQPGMIFGRMRVDGWQWSEGASPPLITPEQEASVAGITVEMRGRKPFRLAFNSLGKPMQAMRMCLAALVKSWGYDPEVQMRLSRRAKPTTPPAAWLSSKDYPDAAYRRNHNGAVETRLDIDENGKVASCYVLARTDPDEFADAVCRAIMARVAFEPALDAEQRPVRSFFVQSLRFLLKR